MKSYMPTQRFVAPQEAKPKTLAEIEAEADAAYATCSRKVQRLNEETEQAQDELQAAGRRREDGRVVELLR